MHADTTSRIELEIGAKLGAIIQNATARERLVTNPAEVLAEVGINSDAAIFADTADLVHLIIPAKIDAARVAAGDEKYFEELGKAALGNCFYEDVPE
ncbi:hypothetical protein ACP90_15635 [Labrenzia sp. CP4]|jgi:hypothetical protein|uniref:hypothetical protein n=1 Tax=Labrenzia sp. CP4 TaxID=1674922 RepID=UPI000783028D|nr:hypothetical protein [Labrenzia sp. CP4]AMN53621.1 hypothetical protein ACP90_15635 [Labrenzia sp. CP4]